MVPKVCFVSSKEKEFDLEMRKIFFVCLKIMLEIMKEENFWDQF